MNSTASGLDLYSGLAVLHWQTISQTDPMRDRAFFREVISRRSGPALELGCGVGRLLLSFREEGLDVSGVDRSAEMLDECHREAKERGPAVTLHRQSMEVLELGTKYTCIYIPCGSLMCVVGKQNARKALERCRAHLEPGGLLAFNLYVMGSGDRLSEAGAAEPFQPKADRQLPDGRRLVVEARLISEDPVSQLWTEERRYRLFQGDELLLEETRQDQGHWYELEEICEMVEEAGFEKPIVTGDYSSEPLGPHHQVIMVVTTPLA